MNSINDKPTEKTYNARRIGWELERTAMGDRYFGNALRVAMDIPGVDDADKAVLQRYATGRQHGVDHVCLQNIAKKVYFSETVPKCKTMTKKEVLDRIHLLSDEVYANEKENLAMQEEIDALYAKINSGEFAQEDSSSKRNNAMNHEYLALASEIKELESIIASIPQENVIERLAFEERLVSAKSVLEHMS